jgi:cysteinyl-tRNA synthetase
MGAEKMSKSLGNVVTPEELLKEHDGETLRLALLSAHYRQPLPWTNALLKQSKARLDRWYRAYRIYLEHVHEDRDSTSDLSGFWEAVHDDLNIPFALATLDQFLRPSLADFPGSVSRKTVLGDLQVAVERAKFLGFLRQGPDEWFRGRDFLIAEPGSYQIAGGEASFSITSPDEVIDRMVAERDDARAKRDFARADEIRDALKQRRIVVEDGPGGRSTWRRA